MDTENVSQYHDKNATSAILQKMKHQKGTAAYQLAKEISAQNIANESKNEKDDRFILQFYLFPLPTYIWKIIDNDMVLIDINQAAMNFSGPKIKDLLGHTASQIYFDVPQIIEWMNQCRTSLHVVRQQFYLSLRTTGERKYLDASWAFFPPEYILFYVSDITEQKEAHTQLEQSVKQSRNELKQSNKNLQTLNNKLEQEVRSHKKTEDLLIKEQNRLEYLLANLPAIVFLINSDQRIIYANQYFKTIIGERMSPYCYEIMFCSQEQCNDCVVEKVISSGTPQTKEWQSQSGQNFAMYYYPFHNMSKEPDVLCLGIDITERKKMEVQLEQARQVAEQSSQFKTQFLARMSHEIRTPMNGVLGITDLLLDSNVTEDQKKYLLTLKSSGEMLLAIINDILDISKIEAGKLELHMRPFDLKSLIDDVYQLLLPKAQEKNIQFSYHFPNEMHGVFNSDPIRIRQILVNLIGNAIKFTDKGSVEIFIEQKDAASEKIGILFEIKDSGPGIPIDQQEQIFQSFTQVNVKQQKYQGTGLGLSICYYLTKMLDGKVWLKSQMNKGTQFFLYLDLQKSEANIAEYTHTKHPSQLDTKDLSQLKILLVEDNPDNQIVFKLYMDKIGCTCDYVDNGMDAIKQVTQFSYHLIFMDIMMPIMDGIQTTKRIREVLPENRQPVIIALTADAFIGKRERYIKDGFDDYCTKPIRLETLLQILDKYNINELKTNQANHLDSSEAYSDLDWEHVKSLKNELKDNYKELIQMTLSECPNLFKSLQQAVDQLNFEKIIEYAHAMKSIINIFGSNPFSMRCKKIELAAQEQLESNIQKDFQLLKKHYHKFTSFLEGQLKN